MQILKLQDQLREDIASNKMGQAIKQLRAAIKKDSHYLYTLITLSAEYNRIADRTLINLADHADADRELNSITHRLLQLIEKLSEDDIQSDIQVKETGWLNPILLLAFSAEAKSEIEAFFRPLDFRKVRFELAEAYRPEWNQTADLTIWDNRDLPYCPRREDMERLKERERTIIFRRLPILEACLAEMPSPHFIHFGEPFFLVNEYRQCVNAANSFYSLYARIRETLDFINTYRV